MKASGYPSFHHNGRPHHRTPQDQEMRLSERAGAQARSDWANKLDSQSRTKTSARRYCLSHMARCDRHHQMLLIAHCPCDKHHQKANKRAWMI